MLEAAPLIAKGSALFRVLDGLADATNIILLVWLLAVLVIGTKRQRLNRKNWLAVLLAIASVYLVKTIDSKLHIWERMSLNYSTHSALAAVVVLSICFLDRTQRALAISVLVAYEVLQILLGFHSPLDIGSTLFVILPLAWLCLNSAKPQVAKVG